MSIVIFGLLGMLIIGTPIAAAFALTVFINADRLNIWIDGLSTIPYDNISSFALVAIPLFILVGELMNRGGLAQSLAATADQIIGRIRASFGYVMILASAFFGAITGSSVATVAAIGSTIGPEMRQRGYPRSYIASLNAASGLLGVLIPPSIPLIIYGSTVGVSITELFIATIVPGILLTLCFAIVHWFRSKRVLEGGGESPISTVLSNGVRERTKNTLLRSSAALIMPIIVLGGIYGGIFTPTEAAAVACLYAICVLFIQRSLNFDGLVKTFYAAAVPAAAILFIIAMTGILNRALILNQIPQDLAALMTGLFENPILFLLAINLLLLLVGMFMETNAAVILMGPLLAPSAAAFGIDPVHFAIVVVTNIEIGLLTPPLAANLYVAARTNNVHLVEMLRHFGWFLLAAVVALLLLTFIPSLSLWYRFF
ncbi:TRAP transporter large permease [Franzmannia qiaohouensis]|uniref:TRAP transporter large permease protein n=1 Tax=Franzmannia qiaohouensis TaxID=1329370 RepID=A0ABU1HJ57_9GAMM|nr:TRAP transporter large permease [Halomonas qiaohouensis]MDR5907522.1 TRAP transporter large permease [Halomonas qiaohouensis]